MTDALRRTAGSLRAVVAILAAVLVACAGPGESAPPETASAATSISLLTEEEAVEIARDALPPADWVVAATRGGLLREVLPDHEDQTWADLPPGDTPVWRIVMRDGDVNGEVLLDAIDGHVYVAVAGLVD